MRRIIKLTAFLLVMIVFSGCSSKQFFEPQEIAGYVSFDGDLPAKIVDIGRDGATLANGNFISKDGLENYKLPPKYLFINKSEGYFIAANPCGDLLIIDSKNRKQWHKKFKNRSVIAATIHKNIVALVFDDNSLMLYNYRNDKFLYTSKQPVAIAADTNVANPYFLGNIAIFPTLDGKLVVVSPDAKELRTIIVGTEKNFNNIIFLHVIDEKLIAATPNKIVSISPTYTNSLSIELRDVVYVKNRVYLLSKDGEILLTDPELQILKKRKYPFAHFVGAIYGEYIYIIEKEGYIIALDRDLRASNIFKFPDTIEEYIFIAGDKVFYNDKYFRLNKL